MAVGFHPDKEGKDTCNGGGISSSEGDKKEHEVTGYRLVHLPFDGDPPPRYGHSALKNGVSTSA